jgi:alkanesulfonate monooxygenase SsuD/methylene tetrahydromethanopterin reductase-like flavin-dependent oxidoreductase (luciferase family)
MLGGRLDLVRQSFDYYAQVADETGWKSGTPHVMYMFKCHADQTEQLAESTARKFLGGVSNPFLEGNEGGVKPWVMNLPGLNPRSKNAQMPVVQALPRGRGGAYARPFEEQADNYNIVHGTPKSILPKIRHILENIRPGGIFMWDGDGAMSHDDQMRSMHLYGQEVLPAVRTMGKELGLAGPFDINPVAGMTEPGRLPK